MWGYAALMPRDLKWLISCKEKWLNEITEGFKE